MDLNSWINITKMANFAVGNIAEFSELTENWNSYSERVKQYFMANEISDDRKVPALLALMGGKHTVSYGI